MRSRDPVAPLVWEEGAVRREALPDGELAQIASLLAAGYLRLLLSRPASAPTLATGAACGAEKEHNTPVDVPAQESAPCGDGRPQGERAAGRPDCPAGRDPGLEDGTAPRGADATDRLSGQVVEPALLGSQGLVVNPGSGASGVRRRRHSDADARGTRPAAKPQARGPDPDPAHTSPGSSAPKARVGHSPRLPGAEAHGNGPRARV